MSDPGMLLTLDEVDPVLWTDCLDSHALWTCPNARERAEEMYEDHEDICNILMGLAPWSVVHVEHRGTERISAFGTVRNQTAQSILDEAMASLRRVGIVRKSLRSGIVGAAAIAGSTEIERSVFGPRVQYTERDVVIALGRSSLDWNDVTSVEDIVRITTGGDDTFVFEAYGPLIRVNVFLRGANTVYASFGAKALPDVVTTAERLLRGARKETNHAHLQMPAL